MKSLTRNARNLDHLQEQSVQQHGRMVWLIEKMDDEINRLKDKDTRARLMGYLQQLANVRMDAEFTAMGQEWSRYFMEENECDQEDITATMSRLFKLEAKQ